MEIKKTSVSSKPKGMVLNDGTFLSPREWMDIKKLFKEKHWSQTTLSSHYDISKSEMSKIVGSTAEKYGQAPR